MTHKNYEHTLIKTQLKFRAKNPRLLNTRESITNWRVSDP